MLLTKGSLVIVIIASQLYPVIVRYRCMDLSVGVIVYVVVRIAIISDECTSFIVTREFNCIWVNGIDRGQIGSALVHDNCLVLVIRSLRQLWINILGDLDISSNFCQIDAVSACARGSRWIHFWHKIHVVVTIQIVGLALDLGRRQVGLRSVSVRGLDTDAVSVVLGFNRRFNVDIVHVRVVIVGVHLMSMIESVIVGVIESVIVNVVLKVSVIEIVLCRSV